MCTDHRQRTPARIACRSGIRRAGNYSAVPNSRQTWLARCTARRQPVSKTYKFGGIANSRFSNQFLTRVLPLHNYQVDSGRHAQGRRRRRRRPALAEQEVGRNAEQVAERVHRFTSTMAPDAENIRPTSHVQVVMDMDGWGPPWLTFDSYRGYVVNHPAQYTGFKIFYHNDSPATPSSAQLHPIPVAVDERGSRQPPTPRGEDISSMRRSSSAPARSSKRPSVRQCTRPCTSTSRT